MTTYNNTFSPNPIFPAFPSFQAISLTSSIALNWPTQFQDVNQVVANAMNFNCTVASLSVTLPDATQGSPGYATLFTNVGSQSFSVKNSSGSSLLTIGVGLSYYIMLTDNTTVAGAWQISQFAGGGPFVFSVNAVSSTPDITVTGGPITTSGTFTVNVGADLASITSFGSATGLATRTAANTWSLISLAGTSNQINVTNPQGIGGNPTFSLNSTITGINSLTVGNLVLTGNSISANNTSGNIVLLPTESGSPFGEVQVGSNISIAQGNSLKLWNAGTFPGANYLAINAGARTTNFTYTMPTVDPVATQVLQCASISGSTALLDWANIPVFSGSSTPSALARFSNNIGSLENSTVLLDSSGNLTGITSADIGDLNIGIINGYTISSPSNNPIIFSPNGVNEVQSNGIFAVDNGYALKFYAPGATTPTGPYFSFSASSSLSSSVSMFLPTTAATAGQALIANSPTQLGWGTIAAVSGATTANAVAKYLNTAGTIENSGVIIDGSNNITGALSLIAGTLSLATNIISSSSSSNIIVAPNSTYELQSNNNINIQSGNLLKWFNTANTFYFSLQSPALTSNIIMNLPLTAAAAGQSLVATSPTQFGWATHAAFTGTSTTNAIAKYFDTAGTIENSGVLIDASNNVTGALTLVAGNVSLSGNTVSNSGVSSLSVTAASGNLALNATSGSIVITGGSGPGVVKLVTTGVADIQLLPAAGQKVSVNGGVAINSGGFLSFENTGNTQTITINGSTATASYTMVMPPAQGTAGQALRILSVAGSVLTMEWAT